MLAFSSLLRFATPVFSLLILTTSLPAMPAHPDIIQKHRSRGSLASLAARSQAVEARARKMPQRVFPASGTRRIPILVIGYSDASLSAVSSQSFYNTLFNGSLLAPLSMKKYFADMSGNALELVIDVHMVGAAANPAAYYGQNSGDFDAKPATLVGEAVDKAEANGVDWSLYDNDNDGAVDVIMVIHAGPGEEFSGIDNHIWSHAWSLSGGKNQGDGTGSRTYDGKTINNYTIQPEYNELPGDSTIGVFCHELLHKLGLPDLYDTTYSTQGVGHFSIMAGGAWLGPGRDGSRPAPMLAWERAALDWVDTVSAASIGTAVSIKEPDSSAMQQLVWGTSSVPTDSSAPGDSVLLLAACVVIVRRRLMRPAHRMGVLLLLVLLPGFWACSDDEPEIPRPSAQYRVCIDDIETSRKAIMIPLGDRAGQQFYLVENKVVKAGTWTEYLPGSGLLISKIHQTVYDTHNNMNSVNDGPARIHGVAIVEADNDAMLWKGQDLEAGTTDYTDSGRQEDLFASRSFTAETSPASCFYTASAAPWSISGTALSAAGLSSISAAGPTMTCICHIP